MTEKISIDSKVNLNYYRTLIKDKYLREDMRKAFNFLKNNKEVLYNLSIDELSDNFKLFGRFVSGNELRELKCNIENKIFGEYKQNDR